jgi:DNA polymerase I-like protein with 3'-5' exonuclease and polymerase domains
MLAMALFNEQLPEHLDAKLILAVHAELVVEGREDQAEMVTRLVEEVMATGMDKVVNSGLDTATPSGYP